VLIWPDMAESIVDEFLANPDVVALKPYHTLSRKPGTFQNIPEEFVPEWAWPRAQEKGLVIVLHLVRTKALLDERNQEYIRSHCLRYPGARLLLAHAGRGFHAPHTVDAVQQLADLDNLWFDSSAICEAGPLVAVLDAFGPDRLLWGSDFPVSLQRGRCVTWGTGFAWVTDDLVQGNTGAFHGQPWPVGLESLRALLIAADKVGLGKRELAAVCAGNARRLFNVYSDDGGGGGALYRHARCRIPGGTQLLSKRPEMFAPAQWPAYFRQARGCRVQDFDGHWYWDCSIHGIGACLLGFNDPDVTRAVRSRLARGSFCTLNPPEEVELADLLCALHPWADHVRFARTGGEAMSVAVRIARATTDRSGVAVCGYHGWHDWYLAANLGENDALRGHLLPGLAPVGVPRELRGTVSTFSFNHRQEFEQALAAHRGNLAAVVMEPCRHRNPEPGFLEYIRERVHAAGGLLVFDEITIGWRLALGGAHLTLGVDPDLAVFAKALGNGHPMAAIIGSRAAMVGAHDSFISSTYWTEAIGPVAALATLKKMQRIDVPRHCAHAGRVVQQAWRGAAVRHGIPIRVPDTFPALAHFSFDHSQTQALRTLYTQEMLKRGFLAGPAFYASLSHTDAVIERYVQAVNEVFPVIADAISSGRIAERLDGPVAHTGFRRLL